MSAPLTERYRPRTLAEVFGQPAAVRQLQQFAALPFARAFLFFGPTGVGKSCAAVAFANDLGVATEHEEPGGFFQIASGEQTEKTVRDVMRSVAFIPAHGSGWRFILVNECDRISDGAAFAWLD